MKRAIWLAVLVIATHAAVAGPVLTPYIGKDVAFSFPKGWVLTEQAGVFVAQQDPKRKDAAMVLVVYSPAKPNVTEDAILDAMTAQVASDLKVTKRGTGAGGGHFVIGEGMVGGIKIRLGAFASISSGQATVCVVVAKSGDFDGLGGATLATQIAATVHLAQPPEAAPAQPQAQPSSAPLKVGPPTQPLTVADLQGAWQHDDHVMKSYVSASTGTYAGYGVIADTEKWFIDAKGQMTDDYTGTHAGVGGTFQVNSIHAETITISGNVFVRTPAKGQGATRYYWIRGWEVRPDITVLKIMGPMWSLDEITDRIKTDPTYGANLDQYWVRISKKPN